MTKSAAGAVGPLLALVAFGLYATHDAIVKHLGATYSSIQILFFAGLLSFPLIAVILLRDPTEGTLMPRHPWLSLFRARSMVGSGVMAFHAFSVLPLAQAYAILFAMPLRITVLAIPVLGERVGLHRGLAVVVGLAGVLIVLRPGGDVPLSLGHLSAITAALFGALSSVIVRRIGRAERSATLLLYPLLGMFAMMGVLLPWVYVPVQLVDLALMGTVSALGLIAAFLIVLAYRRADAAVVAPMQYSQILWATFFGMVFFDEVPDLWTALGAAVIIGSGLYILFREARANVSANRPVLQGGARQDAPGRPLPEGAMDRTGDH